MTNIASQVRRKATEQTGGKYQWAGRTYGVDPEYFADVMDQLALANGGKVQPGDLVDFARDPSSPLHSSFNWDDASAGESWRRHQARNMISSLRVNIRTTGERVVTAPRFVSVKAVDDNDRYPRGYQRVEDAMGEEDMRRQVLENAIKQLRAWTAKYSSLRELADFIAGIDEAIQEIEAIHFRDAAD